MNALDPNDAALVLALDLGGDGPTAVVKDCIDIAGTVTGCGSAAFADAAPAPENAAVVETMLAAGCRIIGKSNMHELAFGMTGFNAFHGTPVNPLWPDRIPGGSSSGSAVAVAAGLCDFAVGTDTGGSVRQPAICCGIIGIKPTYARISRKGLSPENSSLDCVGIFVRDMGMLETAFAAMDPTFARENMDTPPDLAWIETDLAPEVGAPLTQALQDAFPDLPGETLPDLDAAFQAGMTVISYETASAFGYLLDENAPLGADIQKRLTAAREVTGAQLAMAEEVRTRFTHQVDALLERYGALLTPALPIIPPTLEEARDPQSILPLTRFLRPFNLSGHPAITLPARTADGLPIGLQIVGRKGEDAKLCAIARWLQNTLPLLQPTLEEK